jgi:hypothetical protein
MCKDVGEPVTSGKLDVLSAVIADEYSRPPIPLLTSAAGSGGGGIAMTLIDPTAPVASALRRDWTGDRRRR